MFPLHSVPKVIPPDSPPINEFALLSFGTQGVDAIISEIKNNRFFVGIRGFIKYKDVFDRERETRFRYVWKYSMYEASLSDFGNWEKCGQEDENRET